MASTISAGTSAGTAIAIAGDTSGNLAFQTQAGTYTQTVPNATGTVMVSGNMPAFSANNSGTQSISADTATKITFNTENFDTNNNFASNRFTPTVAGYYQINGSVYWGSGLGAFVNLNIYKNGSGIIELARLAGVSGAIGGSSVVYCNGSTDYIELYWYSASGTCTLGYGSPSINFSGSMIRGA
jgi:hypothetical protein